MKLGNFEVTDTSPLFLIAGTCVVETEQMAMDTAGELKEVCDDLGVHLIYKSSFDKANRSSHDSYRGPGLEAGLKVLQKVKDELGLPVLTVSTKTRRWMKSPRLYRFFKPGIPVPTHSAVANTGLPVNIKKGQFLAPWDATRLWLVLRAMKASWCASEA